MKVVLATGIYPPDIGGPATYVEGLAKALRENGEEVTVITYGLQDAVDGNLVTVAKGGGPIFRWLRYARALRRIAKDAGIVVAFSSVSVGIPLIWARLRKPKKILRLGGDFFWERYTDVGGTMDLKEWHASRFSRTWRRIMQWILKHFDHVVYSSEFQRGIHDIYYTLPPTSVIGNVVPPPTMVEHVPHRPFRLLFMGRFVGFKNLPSLVAAMPLLTDTCLTLVGDGPVRPELVTASNRLHLGDRVTIRPPVGGREKEECFDGHDLLVLPSFTEISPNVAAEALARGLPVLLTESSGLEGDFGGLLLRRPMRTPEQIADAIKKMMSNYPIANVNRVSRNWTTVTQEWTGLFRTLS